MLVPSLISSSHKFFSLLNDIILDVARLKAFADDKLNVATLGRFLSLIE